MTGSSSSGISSGRDLYSLPLSAVTVPEFRERDLRITPSRSSIRIDWSVPEAWAASYLVTAHRRAPAAGSGQQGSDAETVQNERIKREVTSDTYTAPPG